MEQEFLLSTSGPYYVQWALKLSTRIQFWAKTKVSPTIAVCSFELRQIFRDQRTYEHNWALVVWVLLSLERSVRKSEQFWSPESTNPVWFQIFHMTTSSSNNGYPPLYRRFGLTGASRAIWSPRHFDNRWKIGQFLVISTRLLAPTTLLSFCPK